MKYFILCTFFSVLFAAQADQLEVILEIEYTLNNVRNTGFLKDDMWLFQHADDPEFEQIIKHAYTQRSIDSIPLFSEMSDHSLIAEKASFHLKKFELIEKSKRLIPLKEIKQIKYRKAYKQSDYTTLVFTDLKLSDTSWIGNDLQTINYGYDDVGCRVYAHITQHSAEQTPLLKLLYELSPKDGSYPTEQEMIEMKAIARKLKKYKAVVTMACGC